MDAIINKYERIILFTEILKEMRKDCDKEHKHMITFILIKIINNIRCNICSLSEGLRRLSELYILLYIIYNTDYYEYVHLEDIYYDYKDN